MAGRVILGIANPALTANGLVDAAATLTFYLNGTTTPQSVYTTQELSVALDNPLSPDAAGRFPIVWAPDSNTYSVKWTPTGASPITYDDIVPVGTANPAGPIHSSWYGISSANSAAVNDPLVQALLDADGDIHFDGQGTIQITTLKTITRSNFRITFDKNVTIQQTGTNANSTIFYAYNKSDIDIEGGTLMPGRTMAATVQGWAIHFQSCTNCWAIDNEVTGHRRGGVLINSCTRSGWRNLYVHDSIVSAGAGDTSSTAGYGGLLANGCTDCHGLGGRSYNGAGIEFAMQTVDSNSGMGYTMQHCSIHADSIVNAPMYGMMAYRLNSNDVWKDCSIRVGLIDTVTGAIPNPSNSHIFGAGIYVQGVEGVTVDFDIIRNTNVNTDAETLAPGAVGVANCRTVIINGRLIEAPVWYGVALFDPNQSGETTAGAGAVVNVGEIRSPTIFGVYCKDFPKARVTAKVIGGDGGFKSANSISTTADRYDLCDFIADGQTSTPIDILAGSLYLSGGYAKPTSAGLFCLSNQGAGKVFVENFTLDGSSCANWPLESSGTVDHIEIGAGVRIVANSGGANAGKVARLAQPCVNLDKAVIENASATPATAYPGAYGMMNTLDDTGTPSVLYLRNGKTGGTTAITNLLDMTEGQRFDLLAKHTVTLTHSAGFYLAGAADQSLVSGDNLPFQMIDGVIYQIAAKA